MPGIGALSLLTIRMSRSTSSSPADATVAAEHAKVSTTPIAARCNNARPGATRHWLILELASHHQQTQPSITRLAERAPSADLGRLRRAPP